MPILTGHCNCKAVYVEITLTTPLQNYTARQCDCDFCVARDVSYLSDPQGMIHLCSSADFKVYKQESNTANFLCCQDCDTLIAVYADFAATTLGALNVSVLSDSGMFTKQSVSPKKLQRSNKMARWQTAWMPISIEKPI